MQRPSFDWTLPDLSGQLEASGDPYMLWLVIIGTLHHQVDIRCQSDKTCHLQLGRLGIMCRTEVKSSVCFPQGNIHSLDFHWCTLLHPKAWFFFKFMWFWGFQIYAFVKFLRSKLLWFIKAEQALSKNWIWFQDRSPIFCNPLASSSSFCCLPETNSYSIGVDTTAAVMPERKNIENLYSMKKGF